MAWGEYPPEYNKAVHGPYDPSRYYGKPDTKLAQVKLGDLGSWLARRKYTPTAMGTAMGRAYWRWQHRWIFPKNAGAACMLQYSMACILFFYAINYNKRYRHHGFYKYH